MLKAYIRKLKITIIDYMAENDIDLYFIAVIGEVENHGSCRMIIDPRHGRTGGLCCLDKASLNLCEKVQKVSMETNTEVKQRHKIHHCQNL
jgi:hypothetical protein